MQGRAPARREAVVERALVEGVPERVAGRERAVRPLAVAQVAEPALRVAEALADRLDPVGRDAESRGHGRRVERRPGDARHLEHVPLLGRHEPQLPHDQLPEVVGHVLLDGRPGGRQSPAGPVLGQPAPGEEIVHQHDHEQGIAVRVGVDDGGDVTVHSSTPLKRRSRYAATSFLAQVLERDLGAPAPRAQRGQHLLDGMIEHRRQGRPVRPQQHRLRALRPLREHRDDVDRALIAPVQILQDEHQRVIDRDRLHQAGELAQHPLRRRVGVPAPQPLAVHGPLQRRHLRQPARGDRAQGGQRPVAGRPVAQPLQGLQHRHVGLSLAVLLDALPVSDQDGGGGGSHRADEGLDERALADPRFALDEDDLPLAGRRLTEQCHESCELRVTPHEGGGLRLGPRLGHDRGHRGLVLGPRTRGSGR